MPKAARSRQDWLIYRDMDQVTQLFSAFLAEVRGSHETFFDPDFNITIAAMEKRGR